MVGRSLRGNGSTLMVVSESHGLPVAFLLEAANTHESQLARDVLAKVQMPKLGGGRAKTRILELAIDCAFDAVSLRQRGHQLHRRTAKHSTLDDYRAR